MKCADGTLLRCEHATALVKGEPVRAVIGDRVEVSVPQGHDKGIIESIDTRTTAFVRKDPAQRTASQVLAANFDVVMIAEPIGQLSRQRLERELVLAHETGARVAVILTKADLSEGEEVERVRAETADLVGRTATVLVISIDDEHSIENVRHLLAPGEVAILIGKSGVGKSSLVNVLAGDNVQDTGAVRERDGRGRHTTVDRVMVELPGGGFVVDMPGIRGLGLWDAEAGLDAAFSDIRELAATCRFRDCKHSDEPGCAVRAAVEVGEIAKTRLDSYASLMAELEQMHERRDEARHLRGEKASDRKKGRGRKRR